MLNPKGIEHLIVILKTMRSLYARWMYNWETRLTKVDNNRVVRPLEWGIEFTREWPCPNGFMSPVTASECEHYLREYNQRAVANSDEFFSYKKPIDFRLERREIQVFVDGPRSASLPGRRTALTAPSRWRSDGARRKARPTDVNLLLTHSA